MPHLRDHLLNPGLRILAVRSLQEATDGRGVAQWSRCCDRLGTVLLGIA